MKNKITVLLFLSVFLLGGIGVYAKHSDEHQHGKQKHEKKHDHKSHDHKEVLVKEKNTKEAPHQIRVKVDGIVCSFCAYGAEKNLSKLSFADKSYYGKDGVFVDIKSGVVTLAVDREETVNFNKLLKAIIKGGYTPRVISFTVNGILKNGKEGKFIITDSLYPNQFHLSVNEKSEFNGKKFKNKDVSLEVNFEIPKKFKKFKVKKNVVVNVDLITIL